MTKVRLLLPVALVALGVLAAGCDSGSNADTSAATTTTAAAASGGGSAKIASFEVPETSPCTKQTFTTVEVTYATSGSVRTELRVDGRPIPLADAAQGTVSADVKCDALPHDFVLFAYDAEDRYTSAQRKLEVS